MNDAAFPNETAARLLCLSGSLRTGSSSKAVIDLLCRRLTGRVTAQRFDIGTLPHYNADLDPLPDTVEAFKGEIANADGLVIVTPEYNYSVPGVLKNAIDWASRPAHHSVLRDKPVLIATVSGGALGGVRAQAHLKYVLNGIMANVFVWQEVVIAHAQSKVCDGRFSDEANEAFLLDAANAFIASIENAAVR